MNRIRNEFFEAYLLYTRNFTRVNIYTARKNNLTFFRKFIYNENFLNT